MLIASVFGMLFLMISIAFMASSVYRQFSRPSGIDTNKASVIVPVPFWLFFCLSKIPWFQCLIKTQRPSFQTYSTSIHDLMRELLDLPLVIAQCSLVWWIWGKKQYRSNSNWSKKPLDKLSPAIFHIHLSSIVERLTTSGSVKISYG